jgi:hypothetical protein
MKDSKFVIGEIRQHARGRLELIFAWGNAAVVRRVADGEEFGILFETWETLPIVP